MSINQTLNYLSSRRCEALVCFSGTVTTTTVDLKGAGGEPGDGWALPRAARIHRIDCWDGGSLKSGTGNVSAAQGDRIGVRAVASDGAFDVKLLLNGSLSGLAATGAAKNSSLKVTVHITLIG